MKNFRKLWLLGALAVLAGCDPYTDENKGPLEILSAFAVAGDSDGGSGFWAASGDTSPFTIDEVVDPGPSVFFVKTNKLLEGSAIQSDPQSCVPAAAVNLSVNGAAAPADWFTCYVPSTSTPAEGASFVMYQGADIIGTDPDTGATFTQGYFDGASLAPGFYSLVATITDKQGNTQTVTINSGAFNVTLDGTPTTTTVDLEWDLGEAVDAGVTAVDVQRAPDAAGPWTTLAADLPVTTTTYADSGLTPETTYWYRIVLKGGVQTLTKTISVDTDALPTTP